MGVFQDWGNALSRPLQRTFQGFRQVFTNPGKANLGDFGSVLFPFIGGTVASNIKHPGDMGYQAATVLGLSAGAGLLAPKAAVTHIGADGFATNLTARAVPTLTMNSSLSVGATAPASTLGASIAGAGKAVSGFIVKAAAVSAAARAIASPWQKVADNIKEMVSGGPSGPGSSVQVSSGGGLTAPAAGDAPQPLLASGGLVMAGILVPLALGALWTWHKGRK